MDAENAEVEARQVAPGKRQRNSLRNREAIIEAARQSFIECGYGAATVRDIIRRTDLAAGTFYNYFPDKESILREIVGRFSAEVRQRVHEARVSAQSLEELLRSAYLACFQFYADDEAMVALIARNAGELHDLSAEAALEPAIDELAEDLRVKSREGILPPIDIEYVSVASIAIGFELGFRMLERRPVDVPGTTEFATQFVLGGIERLAKQGRAE